ncbi:MAG: hypothetical protein ACREFP_15800 [Acetobacteraceae bacterium]
MRTRTSVGLLAAGLLGLGVMAAGPTYAAAPSGGFYGSTASTTAGCPSIVWRLANSSGNIHGMAYYADLSGLSNVEGTIQSDGSFTLTLTKTSIGSGPVGTVTGSRAANGEIKATLKGEGCANNEVDIKPTNNLGLVANGQTGGGGH